MMQRWFCGKENIKFIREKDEYFVSALKSNRLIASSNNIQNNNGYTQINELKYSEEGIGQLGLKYRLKRYF